MLNHIELQGRLTKEPELRTTQAGTSVTSFTIAVERDFQQGGKKETDFVDCVAWRGTGEFISKYFHKGSMIVVTGKLQSRKWQDREGKARTAWEVVVDSAYFCEAKRESTQTQFEEVAEDDGDLPF